MPGSALLAGAIGVLFIGLAKAGFGGGLGMLSTPLCVVAFGPEHAIGILLPLLCAGDSFSLWHYWGKWRIENLKFLLPGVFIGVLIGVQLFNRFSARELNLIIGLLAIVFVLFQLTKQWLFRSDSAFKPNHLVGFPCGVGAGVTSTFAHGAGPVVAVFLIPQKLPKEVFVGTTVLVFTWINWVKLPFFVANDIINGHTLKVAALFFPLVPLGVWVGVWMNRKISDQHFPKVIYALTFLTGLHLVIKNL